MQLVKSTGEQWGFSVWIWKVAMSDHQAVQLRAARWLKTASPCLDLSLGSTSSPLHSDLRGQLYISGSKSI